MTASDNMSKPEKIPPGFRTISRINALKTRTSAIVNSLLSPLVRTSSLLETKPSSPEIHTPLEDEEHSIEAIDEPIYDHPSSNKNDQPQENQAPTKKRTRRRRGRGTKKRLIDKVIALLHLPQEQVPDEVKEYYILDIEERQAALAHLYSIVATRDWDQAIALLAQKIPAISSSETFEQQLNRLRTYVTSNNGEESATDAIDPITTAITGKQQHPHIQFPKKNAAYTLMRQKHKTFVSEVILLLRDHPEIFPTDSIPQPEKFLMELGHLVTQHKWANAAQIICDRINKTQEECIKELSERLIQAQNWQVAERTINISREYKDKLLCMLADALTEHNEYQASERILKSISDKALRSEPFYRLALALVKTDHDQQIDPILKTVLKESLQTENFIQLSKVLLQKQQWHRAILVIKAITDETLHNVQLRDTAMVLAEAHEWQIALQTAKAITDIHMQEETLCYLGEHCANLGMNELMEQVINAITNKKQHTELSLTWIQTLIMQNKFEQAQLKAEAIPDHYQQSQLLSQLGEIYIQTKQWSNVERAISYMNDPDIQLSFTQRVATELVNDRQWKQLKHIINAIVDIQQQDKILLYLTKNCVDTDQWQQLENIIGLPYLD
ncbi:hypothetical protein KDW_39350 [Dictyobacter vulcani]|uniref:Uncharacterized protein n=1 Tax=Dictyobacter vulcani TaxID=2607529 RepID=A0A5J4KQ98_9CHLR|nr:hypothetical protein [Dictyobacter vulcani]GER89773.1 hypothetical protein KDW_39350 [Dictyobacter vulcani]